MSKFSWLLATLALALAPAALHAQQPVTIAGRVTEASGTPVVGAQVFIASLSLGTTTGADGTYRLSVPAARATGQSVSLSAQRTGFAAQTRAVTLTEGASLTQNFQLAVDLLRLDEIVVTGAGTEQRAERLGTARATVQADQIKRSNEVNLVTALAGKVPGVVTNQQSGDAGASTAIQIRGAKSFGTSQPLFVVDGVPITNSTRSINGPLQGAAVANRAIDINPEDIESIEILKGAAATSIYGASAGSAGAILITTKRGQPGRTQYTLRSTYQADKPVQMIPLQHKYGVGSNGVSSNCTTLNCSISSNFFSWGPALAAGTPTYDHASEMYETGSTWDNTLTASGGSERTTFYASVGALNQNGFMAGDNDYFKRTTARFNGSHAILDDLRVGASGTYVQSNQRGHQRGNQIGGVLGALRSPTEFNNKQYLSAEGMHRSYRFPNPGPTAVTSNRGFDNPFYFMNEAKSTSEVGRYLGNVNASYTPFSWLAVNYTLGADYASDDRTEAFPQQSSGGAVGGQITRWQFYDRLIDHTLSATSNFDLTSNIQSSISVGQNLNETYFRQVTVTGQTWIAPQPFKLANTVTRQTPSDSESRTRTEGYFLQATTDFADQLFLQARIRNDANSRFGQGNQRAWYPGGSVAWSFTRAVHLPESLVSFGKLRLAYGETGQQPPIYATQDIFTTAAFADYSPGSILVPTQNGIGGLYTAAGRGNPDIRPERVRELETGVDLSLLGGRADLGITRYDSRSSDVVFGVGTPPSTGYTSVTLNAGELSNKGWEATLNVRPVQRRNLSLEVGANWAMNRNVVMSLGEIDAQRDGSVDRPTKANCGDVAALPRCQIGFSSSFSGQSTHNQVGYPVGVWRGNDFARCGRGLTTISGNNVEAACQGAKDGALYIGADGFPIVDPNVRVVGSPEADWTGGLSATLSIRGVQLSALLDHRQGGDVLNMTRGSISNYGTHKDTEIRGETRTFGKDWLCHNKTCDVLNGAVVGPGAGKGVVIGESWFTGPLGSVGGPTTTRIEDATNTRLREVTVGYTFKTAWLERASGMRQMDVKLSGRNLKLWTNYSGFDPETNLGGAEAGNRGIDWFNNPLSQSWVMSVTLQH